METNVTWLLLFLKFCHLKVIFREITAALRGENEFGTSVNTALPVTFAISEIICRTAGLTLRDLQMLNSKQRSNQSQQRDAGDRAVNSQTLVFKGGEV